MKRHVIDDVPRRGTMYLQEKSTIVFVSVTRFGQAITLKVREKGTTGLSLWLSPAAAVLYVFYVFL